MFEFFTNKKKTIKEQDDMKNLDKAIFEILMKDNKSKKEGKDKIKKVKITTEIV